MDLSELSLGVYTLVMDPDSMDPESRVQLALDAFSLYQDINDGTEVIVQGLTQGAASGAAGLGDLAVDVGWNWTVREGVNLFNDEEDELEALETNFAADASEFVTWVDMASLTETELAMLAGSRAVGEAGIIVVSAVATGGAAGAAFGAARGAGAVAGASRAASATWNFVNPVASRTALIVEGGFASYSGWNHYVTELEAAQTSEEVYARAATQMTEDIVAEQEKLQRILEALKKETVALSAQYGSPDTPLSEKEALVDRINEIRELNDIIDDLHTNISNDRRLELHAQLDRRLEEMGLVPVLAAPPAMGDQIRIDRDASEDVTLSPALRDFLASAGSRGSGNRERDNRTPQNGGAADAPELDL